ncbi:MAG: hypothetical protein GWP05_05725 [Anaerolineaceae bacterium]|nr:hypothetical protein [Anaerolineaceae bacterium]
MAALALSVTAVAAQGAGLADEAAVNAFAFADARTGLAVGEAGLVLSTTDGGLSWRRLKANTTVPLLAATMIDAQTAFVAGGGNLGAGIGSVGLLLKTTDGGRSWLRVPVAAARFWGLTARGKSLAAWGEAGPRNPGGLVVSHTAGDAGATWGKPEGAVTSTVLTMRWTADGRALLVTADGVAWRLEKNRITRLQGQAPPGRITAAHIFSPRRWIVALESGLVVRTGDAGQSWRSVTTDGPSGGTGLRHFAFLDGEEGWFVGRGPAGIQFTANGGLKWSRVGPSPPGPLGAAHFRDAWNGLVAGPFGSLYRTTDGGGSWKSVRGGSRRAALCIVEPYGSVGDWPLVSMLSGDRGYRTLIWSATRPVGEPLVVAERRLRDAAWALGSAEAMILALDGSARIDGPPGFDPVGGMPHLAFAPADPGRMAAVVREVARLWKPAVVLGPSPKSGDAEEAFVARFVAEGARARVARRWVADPLNRTAGRLPGSRSDYPVAVNPLSPSETFGVYHGARARMAAQLFLRRRSVIAESLGYKRIAAERPDSSPMALLEDLHAVPAAARRDIGPTAAFALGRRLDWQRKAAAFYPQFRIDLDDGNFAAALGAAAEFADSQSPWQLAQICMMDLVAAAGATGDLQTAVRAAESAGALSGGWPPRRIEALLFLLDVAACRELGGDRAAAAQPVSSRNMSWYESLWTELGRTAPTLLKRTDLQHQWLRQAESRGKVSSTDDLAMRSRIEQSAGPVLQHLVALENWNNGGRRGDPPIVVVRLRAKRSGREEPSRKNDLDTDGESEKSDEKADAGDEGETVLSFGLGPLLKVKETALGLYFVSNQTAAAGWWLTIDTDGDGRTLLAEPLADKSPPSQALMLTAAAPLWVRRPGLWTRRTRGDRLALGLNYERLGGRPPRRTVWLVTLRKQVVDGLRPVVMPAMKNHGCFAILFD